MADSTLHPCARCAALQRTCCQRSEILVTGGDIERIGRHTGWSDFWSSRAPVESVYLEDDPDDPNWRSYTVDAQNRRKMLLRRESGDCAFLGSHGCTLPTEVRPLVCRLYPFAYTERGLEGIADGHCPREELVPREKPGVTMLTVLGMNPDDGRRWHAMLYDELRRERLSDAHRPDV